MRKVKLKVKQERNRRHVCQWPGCPVFATIEKAQGPKAAFKRLCPKHSAQFDLLGSGAADNMHWSPVELRTL